MHFLKFSAVGAHRDDVTSCLIKVFDGDRWVPRPTLALNAHVRTSLAADWEDLPIGPPSLESGIELPPTSERHWIAEWEDRRGNVVRYSLTERPDAAGTRSELRGDTEYLTAALVAYARRVSP
jgi:hypothetical protein